MRLDRLLLRNFRAFSELDIDLHPELTVLVAPNGGGKTAVLDAISLALAPYVDALAAQAHPLGLRQSDVRRVIGADRIMEPVLPTSLHVEGVVAGAEMAWDRALLKVGGRTVNTWPQLLLSALDLRQEVVAWAERKRPSPPLLPIVAAYGTGRLWATPGARPSRKVIKADTSRFSGYTDCLSPTSSFGFFADWFERFSREAQAEKGNNRASPHRPRERLRAVERSVNRLLAPSAWTHLEWDFGDDQLVATHADHGRLPVSWLSDGVRNMIGLVGDIAHRCARLNPHLGERAAEETPGIVLIDEVDMHLHPRWQQQVVDALRGAFPGVQLVLTTHSPQVISTLRSELVRIIDLREGVGKALTPPVQTIGVESADVLATVMHVDPRPDVPEVHDFSAYRALIQQGLAESGRARELRVRLEEIYGEKHPLILDADRLIRFQAFKSKHGDAPQGSA